MIEHVGLLSLTVVIISGIIVGRIYIDKRHYLGLLRDEWKYFIYNLAVTSLALFLPLAIVSIWESSRETVVEEVLDHVVLWSYQIIFYIVAFRVALSRRR